MAGSLLRTALVSAAAITSVSAKPREVTKRQSEPCAQISQAFSGGSTFVSSDTALACLQSVPLDKTGNVQQIAGLRALMGFQSDLSYLIKPPAGYLYPAVDVKGGLDKIESNLNSGFYSNEYDFQLDIYKLIAATYDGHTQYQSDILGVFFWMRLESEQLAGGLPQLYQIISVSTDGVELPSVYSALDAPALYQTGSTGYTPSPISQINAVDVEDWLNTYATVNGNGRQQDPDANYNSLFPSTATDSVPALAGGYGNIFAQAGVYQGSDTVLKFANGSTAHVMTVAGTSSANQKLFSRVTDGSSFFQTFCSNDFLQELKQASGAGGSPSSSGAPVPVSSFAAFSSFAPNKRAAITERAPAPQASSFGFFSSALPLSSQVPLSQHAASGSAVPSSQVPYKAVPTTGIKPGSPLYPDPFVASSDYSVAGYFPQAQNDLAVLAIPSYEPSSPSQFSNVVRKLLATAKSDGKTKLIIDLRGNPGGYALMATDTFKQLFPSQDPYGAGNYRANALFNFTGQSFSDFFEGVTYKQSQQQGTDSVYAGTPFNVDNEVTKAYKDFNSWADFFGPVYYHGDNYTQLTRWNLSDPAQRTGLSIYGYGMDDAPQPQTFQPDNIVMLLDGACASTCTLFTELMKNQANVKSIAVGGRKRTGPMQGVGGIKGANVLGMAQIFQYIAFGVQAASAQMQQVFVNTFGNSLVDQIVKALSRAAPSPSNIVAGTFNFRNNFREGDSTNTPLQYVYEASDWRFFYTIQMYAEQAEVWTKAYNIVWKGANAVQGSTGQTSSGFGTGYILSGPPAGIAMDQSIFPSKNLGKAVKPSATASAFGPQNTGNGAAGLGVSAGVMMGGLAAAMAFM